MNWGIGDFIAAGLILSALATSLLLIFRWRPAPAGILALALSSGAAAVSAWAALAVGVIGDGRSLLDLVYLAFLPGLVVAVLLSRLAARLMGRLLLAFAILQAGLCAFLLLAMPSGAATSDPAPVLVFNFILLGIWSLSSWLFYLDTRQQKASPDSV